MRRTLIPAKRSSTYDKRDSNVGAGKTSSNDMDDRIHNALLEELCADFGVTDSSYVDFLGFDIPTDRVESGHLPADLEELGEIVSFGTCVKPKMESVHNVAKGIRKTSSSCSHASLLGPRLTTAKATSGMIKMSDNVASPTISSSCEDSKPADGGGEGLSDFPPTVHSTTDCASGAAEDHPQQSETNISNSVVKNEQVLVPSTQLPDEQGSSAASPLKDQSDRNDSTASSPKHIAKKARVIASGGDLLEDVKKSYAFVCGADIFAPPSRPAVSHPRLHTPVRWHRPLGCQNELQPYCQNATGYGTRASFRDGYGNQFQYGVQNIGEDQQAVSDKSYGTSSLQSANFDNSTPVKGFRQRYCNEWQTSPASSLNRSYQTNIVHRTNMAGNVAVNFPPNDGQFTTGQCSSTGASGTSSDTYGSVPYADGSQFPRAAEFPRYVDQNHLSYQSVNSSPRSTVDQSGRSYGYPSGPYADGSQFPRTAEHGSRQSGLQKSVFYSNPLASPYHNLPSRLPDASVQHRTATANESGQMYLTGQLYPAQHTYPVNGNTANYNDQVDRSSAASPVRYRDRSATPGFVSSYTGIENYIPESNSGNLQYNCNNSAIPAGQTSSMESNMQPAPLTPGIQNNGNFHRVPTPNEFSFSRVNTGIDVYAEQRRNFPRSPVSDPSVVNQMTPRRGRMPLDAEQSYSVSSSVSVGRTAENGCLSFVRHLIGSGSGPYRSHPLFPLLRDLVIADMNFEAPSFPYPLIAGLPRSFDRLISNYFSCTAHNANTAGTDPAVDAIVMDALRYAHSALLGNFVNIVKFIHLKVINPLRPAV